MSHQIVARNRTELVFTVCTARTDLSRSKLYEFYRRMILGNRFQRRKKKFFYLPRKQVGRLTQSLTRRKEKALQQNFLQYTVFSPSSRYRWNRVSGKILLDYVKCEVSSFYRRPRTPPPKGRWTANHHLSFLFGTRPRSLLFLPTRSDFLIPFFSCRSRFALIAQLDVPL